MEEVRSPAPYPHPQSDSAAKQRPAHCRLVDRILAAKDVRPVWGQNPPDTSAMEVEVDRLVYELYGLTEGEVAAVEGRSG